ncbi:MAG TPA: glycosyltransferase family 4 protein [Candidatus Binataceae bacterium]|nr:glycosyltransferase family 4 protein [Candidatus Binataceae bacterium]
MRILGVDPELRFAGGETQVLGLTMGLLRAGHRAELACDPRGQLFDRARREGIECHPLAIRNSIDVGAGMRLRNLLSRTHYDIVHFHTSRAHSMAPFARGHAGALVVTRRMDYLPNRLFAPYLYNRAVDAIAAISSKVAESLGEAGVARDRLRIIPSGVDCEHFRPASSIERESARARLSIGPADFLVGTVGMLEERKGHRYLLEAVAILNRTRATSARIKCVIAGDGAMRADLIKLASDSGISNDTTFLSLIPDPRSVLDALDVFVFPSLREGLGVALLEAMGCGIPPVASRAGGIVDIIEHTRSGMLVEPRDSASLANAMATLAADASLRVSMGIAARARIEEHFSLATTTRMTIDMYRDCLLKRPRRLPEVKS